ncbi:MAG TPA: DNA (cytosine-5-)-methyltransferase [Mesotoga sp.]|nr:DNA (cytosine-5-)-methyltransferase [Mesotoga sp.]
MRITAKSYFSGAGGMDLGLSMAGIDIIQSLEIDPKCVATMNMNFSHAVINQDICDVLVKPQAHSDVMVFTFPCTKYSSAADINGTRTGDDLFLHAFRHAALAAPEIFVVENVPGMKKFPVVMEAFQELPGYYVTVFCPVDALDCGLPQRRERLIMIGSRRPFSPEPPRCASKIKLKEILEKDVQVEVPEYVIKRLEGNYRDRPIISDPEDPDSYAPTCVAHYSKDRGTRMVKDPKSQLGCRPYTVREYARLQGFPDNFIFVGSESDAYRMIGNAVAVPMAEWIGREVVKYFS